VCDVRFIQAQCITITHMAAQRPVKLTRWKLDESGASAYLRDGQLILHGSCITEIGNVQCAPYRTLAMTSSDDEIGVALLDILAMAKDAPPPTDLKDEERKLFAAAGIRSWAKLTVGTVHCSIQMTPRKISVLPTRREGKTFHHVPDQTMGLPHPVSAAAVGRLLREQLAKSS
jgi:hypothetical protein